MESRRDNPDNVRNAAITELLDSLLRGYNRHLRPNFGGRLLLYKKMTPFMVCVFNSFQFGDGNIQMLLLMLLLSLLLFMRHVIKLSSQDEPYKIVSVTQKLNHEFKMKSEHQSMSLTSSFKLADTLSNDLHKSQMMKE